MFKDILLRAENVFLLDSVIDSLSLPGIEDSCVQEDVCPKD